MAAATAATTNTNAWESVSRLWINSLLDRRDAIAGAQLP